MSTTFEEHCRKLQIEVDALAQKAEVHSCFDHLRAFNFGRCVARIEYARDVFWLRVRWLLLGAAVGMIFTVVHFHILSSSHILQFAK